MIDDDARDETAGDEPMAHLQSAAREVIGAARALLDAAEKLVEDPAMVGRVVSMVSTFAQAASTTVQQKGPSGSADASSNPDDGEGDGNVERIVVS